MVDGGVGAIGPLRGLVLPRLRSEAYAFALARHQSARS